MLYLKQEITKQRFTGNIEYKIYNYPYIYGYLNGFVFANFTC